MVSITLEQLRGFTSKELKEKMISITLEQLRGFTPEELKEHTRVEQKRNDIRMSMWRIAIKDVKDILINFKFKKPKRDFEKLLRNIVSSRLNTDYYINYYLEKCGFKREDYEEDSSIFIEEEGWSEEKYNEKVEAYCNEVNIDYERYSLLELKNR